MEVLKVEMNQPAGRYEGIVVSEQEKQPTEAIEEAACSPTDDQLPVIGLVFYKLFGKDYYRGTVVSGPETVVDADADADADVDNNNSQETVVWHVKYEDDEQEDLTQAELNDLPRENPERRTSKRSRRAPEKILGDLPVIGLAFYKQFGENYFRGTVVSGPETVNDEEDARELVAWHVKYEDDEEEDLTEAELQILPRQKPKKKPKPTSSYDIARESLLYIPGMTESEVERALQETGPPYGLQAAMNFIQQQREDPNSYNPSNPKQKFKIEVGLKIRMSSGGCQYLGQVTSESQWKTVEGDNGQAAKIRMWEVTYEDGTTDDLDWYQLLQARADRPTTLHSVRGRTLGALELFSGCGMVSQEFAERKWKVRSVDNSPTSYATDKMDIMKFSFQDIGYVPDFIWASPPCFTYSLMAGGRHRSAENDQWEKTPEALEHNHLFAKMVSILHQAKLLNPHLIMVIENPVGLLYRMPLLQELVKSMNLHRVTVDYCTLGRSDKKPTHLWTNDFGLMSSLSEFQCSKKCPYYKKGVHPVTARGQGALYNAAAIPNPLAEEVAEYVHSKFVLDRIRYKPAAQVPPPQVAVTPNNGSSDSSVAATAL